MSSPLRKAMSEVALAPVAAQPGPLTTARARRNRLNPLEGLERGFALFRSTFAREAWRYYVGAAPLVVCFIPMWVVNGQIRLSNGVLLMEAALLAGTYLLRVLMIASYVQGVRERAFGVPRPNFSGAFARAAATGRLLAWKITLSAAALATLVSVAGAPWFYGACQFAALEAGEDASERHSLRGCLALAGQWYGGSLLLFLMFIPLWIAVWLNGFIMALVVPQLLHSIFGVDTLLSTMMGIYALLRSSAFWLSLFAGAWLALDPIVKCSFVVVSQHLQSRREGDDLRGLLARLPREAQVQKLRRALDEESRRAIYRWHDAEHPSPPTWFDKLLDRIQHRTERAWDAVQEFFRKLWPRGLNLSLGKGKQGTWKLKDLRL